MIIEMYLILLSNLVGLQLLLISNDWIITILSWELINFSLYLLISLNYKESESTLASALKYFIVSALSTILFLLGIWNCYILSGSTQYSAIKLVMLYNNEISDSYLGLSLLLIASLLKLAAVPFHNWASDLYNATKTHITMWLMIIPKLGLLGFLIVIIKQFNQSPDILNSDILQYILLGTGTSSLIIGSLGLYSQWKIKRFLAYSGFAHLGFILLSAAQNDLLSLINYTIIYVITSFNVFLILLYLGEYQGKEILYINQLAGTFNKNKYLGLAFIIAIFSFIGLPPMAGFYAKLFVISSIIKSNWLILIAIIIVITSAISSAKYLSLIRDSILTLSPYNSSVVKLTIKPSIAYTISFITCYISLLTIFKPTSIV